MDPVVLKPFVAAGTELDLWNGQALASVVAFDFRDTRVLGLPIPFHVRFPEVNLRFYVRRRAPDGSWRRGVSFVQELVPKRAIAFVARAVYGEPYVRRRMRQSVAPPSVPGSGGERTLRYEWKRAGIWESVTAVTTQPAAPLAAGSIEEFIAEHYWGYTHRPGEPSMEYEVVHPQWNVQPTERCVLDANVEAMYGARFVDVLGAPPVSTFVADGSRVAVHKGVELPR